MSTNDNSNRDEQYDDSKQNDAQQNDERLTEMFASVEEDAAEVDKEFLDQLRERSTEEFSASGGEPSREDHSDEKYDGLPRPSKPVSTDSVTTLEGHRTGLPALLSHATTQQQAATAGGRWLICVTVASLLIACGVFVFGPRSRELSLGQVLRHAGQAETLHLKIVRGRVTGEAWVKRPGRLRWDVGDGSYQIADGSKLWVVEAGVSIPKPQRSNYWQADGAQFDLLDLLPLPESMDRKVLLDARPTGRIDNDGRSCNVYRARISSADGDVRIRALVDAETNRLHSLQTTIEQVGKAKSIAELTVLEFNQPINDEMFAVNDRLTDDDRLGKVVDMQGTVTVKPAMQRRWSPVTTQLLLKPGDWLRTDSRGANAVAVRLTKQRGLTLGPGSLVEVVSPDRVLLIAGELAVRASVDSPLEVRGFDSQVAIVKQQQVLRLADHKLVQLGKKPPWLLGFEGTTANESLGSLVAKVDERDVPLTVGYHKVTVDIRDQIARTVIEESFVNHTDSQLEGVFYFPLPPDASISGFGMWIGDELVEADVVEKQRAREIYETILRERRDPGLLEWAGGNIFKARVFPIFANSEKRIKITYTQVLPMQGNRYRYSYGLQSEMLKQNPLR